MVIIYTSSRRAVLRRFAALLIAPQRFVCYNASCRTTPQCFVSRRPAIQLNDLFVTTQRTPLLTSPPCIVLPRSTGRRSATRLNATICLLRRYAAYGIAALFGSPPRLAPLLNSTICLLQRNELRLDVSPRVAGHRSATRRNSTICLLLRSATQLNAAQCNSSGLDAPRLIACLLNSTICLLQRRLASSQLDACRLAASLCNAPQFNATN